jgi:hypothetical protein
VTQEDGDNPMVTSFGVLAFSVVPQKIYYNRADSESPSLFDFGTVVSGKMVKHFPLAPLSCPIM